jgi:hypothetical protein
MAMFDAGKTCVFSQVKAKLTLNGEPVRNTKVVRRWEWNKLQEDSTSTDDNGYFEFPAVYESSLSRLLPVELVIGQQLSTEIDGKEFQFWTNSKREPTENSEYGGKSMNLICELSGEEELIEDYGSLMVTLCKMEK